MHYLGEGDHLNLALVMLIGYLAITTAISVFFTRKNANSTQYFVAERSLGTGVIIAMLFSEIIAGAGTIGNAASAFQSGLSSVWANWGMAIGCFLFVPLVSKFYRAVAVKKGAMSVPQAYSYLFDKKTKTLMIVIVVVVYIILYSTQAVAAASIIAPLLNADTTVATWCIAGLFILITVTGGMKGIAWMNTLHAVVMYVGMGIVALKAVTSVGGVEVLVDKLPQSYFSFAQPTLWTAVAGALGTGLSFLASSNVTSCVFSAKSQGAASRGIFLGGLSVIPFALFPAIIGMCAKVAMPDIVPNNALFGMANSMGSIYGGLVSMAIVAAIWSTAPALLLIVTTTATRDLYKEYIRPNATEVQQMRFSKLLAVVVGIGGTFLGMNASSILDQMLGAFQIRSVAGIVLVIAIFWPRVHANAAFWSMLFGGAVAAIWQFTGQPFGIAPLWPATAVCLVILIPLTLASRQAVSPGHQLYQNMRRDMVKNNSKT